MRSWIGTRDHGDKFVSRFTIVTLQPIPSLATQNLDLTLQWWLPSPLHDDDAQFTVAPFSSTSKHDILVPWDASPDAELGVHVYLNGTQNKRHQPVQRRLGTGFVPLNHLEDTIHIPILDESSRGVFTLVFRVVSSPPLPQVPKMREIDECLAMVTPSSSTRLKRRWDAPETNPEPLFFADDDPGAYRRRLTGTFLKGNKQVPVWDLQCLPGETMTDAAFYENALQFALWLCGDEDDFVADPLSFPQVLQQVVGYLAWACRYTGDNTLDGKETEQFAMIRDHPNEETRAGDCEDLSREMWLAFYWLTNVSPDSLPTPQLKALQALACEYRFLYVDCIALLGSQDEKVLHQYVKLAPKRDKLPLLFLDSTEHTILPRDQAQADMLLEMALQLHGKLPRPIRLLHTSQSLIEGFGFHKMDLLFFGGTAESSGTPQFLSKKYGAPSDVPYLPELVPVPECTPDHELQHWLVEHMPVVPTLSVPTKKPSLPNQPCDAFLKCHTRIDQAMFQETIKCLVDQKWNVYVYRKGDKWISARLLLKGNHKVDDYQIEVPVTRHASFWLICLLVK